jgi:hypothetical protein
LFRSKVVTLTGRQSGAGAGADSYQFFATRADVFDRGFLLGPGHCAFYKSDVKSIVNILGLQDANMSEIKNLFPFLPMVIHHLGHHYSIILATGK